MKEFEITHSRLALDNGTVLFNDIGILHNFNKAEFQIAKSSSLTDCDFEIQINDGDWSDYDIQIGDWIYIPETEWGGRVEAIDHSDDNIIKVSGPNLAMALLMDEIVCPPYNTELRSRDDYLYINNIDANEAIRAMHAASVVQPFTELITIPEAEKKHQIKCQCRYEYLLTKINSVFDDYDLRLKVTHSYDSPTPFIVEAVEKNVIDEFYNQDLGISINSTIDTTSKYELIIGLGQGDLHERQVIIMKVTDIGGKLTFTDIGLNDTIRTNDSIKQYVYDYSSAESIDDLRNGMIKEYKDNLSGNTGVSISVNDDATLDLGDKISAMDNVTGLSIDSEITKKVLTIDSTKITYSYSTQEGGA